MCGIQVMDIRDIVMGIIGEMNCWCQLNKVLNASENWTVDPRWVNFIWEEISGDVYTFKMVRIKPTPIILPLFSITTSPTSHSLCTKQQHKIYGSAEFIACQELLQWVN